MTVEDIHQRTQDRSLVPAQHPRDLVEMEDRLREARVRALECGRRRVAAARPSSTASPTGSWPTSGTPASERFADSARARGIAPVYKLVDTCAAEFEAYTPYYYSTYESPVQSLSRSGLNRTPIILTSAAQPADEDETRPSAGKDRIMILGGGPNRIGQGIEFDYCCCQAAFALAAKPASKPSWSTPTRRPSPPITTPAIISSSSR